MEGGSGFYEKASVSAPSWDSAMTSLSDVQWCRTASRKENKTKKQQQQKAFPPQVAYGHGVLLQQ